MTRLALLLFLPATAVASPHPACDGLQGQAFGQCQAWFASGCDVDPTTNHCQALLGHCDVSTVWEDLDADGYGAGSSWDVCAVSPGTVEMDGDCDDADADVSPAAEEVCDNGVDDDCDGEVDEDCGAVLLGRWAMDFEAYGYHLPGETLPFTFVLSGSEQGPLIGDELWWTESGTAVVDASNDADFAQAAAEIEAGEPRSLSALTASGEGWTVTRTGPLAPGTITHVEFVGTLVVEDHGTCLPTGECLYRHWGWYYAYLYGTP